MNDFDPEKVTFQAHVIGVCTFIIIGTLTVIGLVKLVDLIF